MFQRSELQQIGRRVLAGGLIVAAITLSVIIVDQVVTGGTSAIRATCVLFLWTGGAAIVFGMILRIAGGSPRGSRPHAPNPPPTSVETLAQLALRLVAPNWELQVRI